MRDFASHVVGLLPSHLANRTINIHPYELEDDDDIGGTLKVCADWPISKEMDHFDVLVSCLQTMYQDERCRNAVQYLTTDGDNRECEAIFEAEGEGWILRVR